MDHSVLRSFEAGQVIFSEDSRPIGLFAVLEGQVATTRQIGDSKEFFYHLGGAGFWFGESGVLTRNLTLITATARTPVQTLFLSMQKFDLIVKQDPAHFQSFTALQSIRYALVLRHMAQCTGLAPEAYLRVRLADISDMIHSEGGDEGVVDLTLSQIDVANMIGVSRQTVNVLLKKLEKEGLIEVSFRKIRIIDPKALRDGRRTTGL